MTLNGSQIIIECLKEQGVDTVFGYPGGAILNVYNEFYAHPEIQHILTSHEQGAAHAADGYARASGKVGVCFATSGPGATNLVTGIATAYMDSVPMVAITCNVTLPLLGKDSFQEVDIAGITQPITKHSCIVKDVEELAPSIRKAFALARSGRPGPVLVDVTKDVTAASCEFEAIVLKEEDTYVNSLASRLTIKPGRRIRQVNLAKGIVPQGGYVIPEELLSSAAKMICEAKRPFICVGGGTVISGAEKEVMELAEFMNAPVCDTLMGKGGFPGDHEKYTGMIGMHGTKTSNIGVSKCDLFISLGMRFSDRVLGNASRFAKGAKIIHFDIDAAEINKNIRTDLGIVEDIKTSLGLLLEHLRKNDMKAADHTEWMKEIKQLKEKHPLGFDTERLNGPMIIAAISEITGGDAIITTDVGQHQMWAAQFYKYLRGRQFLSSGGLGTMGYGLGACIGAKLAKPDTLCINVAGDGCFRMNMQELATASRYDIPIVEVVVNNHVLGMVRQWQNMFYDKHYSHTILEDKVDFCTVARGLGCEAIEVKTKEELKPALEKAIAMKRPVVINCIIDKDDKVWPMVPAGQAIESAIDAGDYKE